MYFWFNSRDSHFIYVQRLLVLLLTFNSILILLPFLHLIIKALLLFIVELQFYTVIIIVISFILLVFWVILILLCVVSWVLLRLACLYLWCPGYRVILVFVLIEMIPLIRLSVNYFLQGPFVIRVVWMLFLLEFLHSTLGFLLDWLLYILNLLLIMIAVVTLKRLIILVQRAHLHLLSKIDWFARHVIILQWLHCTGCKLRHLWIVRQRASRRLPFFWCKINYLVCRIKLLSFICRWWDRWTICHLVE